MRFEFNLSGTSKKLSPKLSYAIPILNIGDKFVGNIEIVQLVQLNKEKQNINMDLLLRQSRLERQKYE